MKTKRILSMRTGSLFAVLLLLACNLSQSASPPTAAPPESQPATGLPTDSSLPNPTPSGEELSTELVRPQDLEYMGAFRLPEGPEEIAWSWGGAAMAYYVDGDPGGPADGFPGSLFGTGHDWNQYLSEISIPPPVISASKNVEDLNTAATLQDFQNIRGDFYDYLDFELPRAGLAYLPPQGGQTTGKLYFSWGQHYQWESAGGSHGWAELDLSNPQSAGTWYIGEFTYYSVNDYIFPIDPTWAAAYTPGMLLATGRFRDGGWSGQGPSLFAYGPWLAGNPPPPDTRLDTVPLILYGDTFEEPSELTMENYSHADEWNGGAWMTAGDRSAVIFVGTKGVGETWYGFANGVVWPDDPPYPEVPDYPNDDRGWWSTATQAQIIFYDPADLAAVARGEMEPHQPQPYATLDVSPFLFNQHSSQQKYLLGAASFDRERGLLYVFELFGDADWDRPLVHVWRVDG